MNTAIDAQIRAADPGASSWVSANAGSGKTRVLTDRVARLLLGGTDPQKILCLTYTKAAAAEMQNRLFRTLGDWAMLPDDRLRAALRTLGAGESELIPDRLAHARTLFARALETPGGLKIQTIHAFCETLLRRFPLEAGVAPQFSILDDRQASRLRAEVLDTLAKDAPAVLAGMARHLSGDDPDALLREINHHRVAFDTPLDLPRLANALGVQQTDTVSALAGRVLDTRAEVLLRTLVPILEASSKNDRTAAAVIEQALRTETPELRLKALEAVLLTKSGAAPFTAKTGSFPTKSVRAAYPDLMNGLDTLMQRTEVARGQRLSLAALARSEALHAFARAYLGAFGSRKRALAMLDFDDLIIGAHRLIEDRETAAWVLWRLDGGIDHILVDEAQDTSPAQWRVVEALSAEFFVGQGAREVIRTIFVVGDEKQSIYSFQGADPAAFGGMRGHFDRMLTDMGNALAQSELLYSFRSAAPILRLVDAVYEGPAGGDLGPGITHHPIDPERPGRVDVWPFLPKPYKPEDGPWDDPVDAPGPGDPVAALAAQIATQIAGMIADRQLLPGAPAGRAIRAGDVLILVQTRGPIFHAIIRALKRADVPVAGADVLTLSDELAVKDLLAALRFASTPRDDLSLAALLRSPIGGLSEDELFSLAHARTGSLWGALQAEPPGRWPAVRALLTDLLNVGGYLRPFEVLTRLLIRHDGRRRLVSRLGAEVDDGIDALLDQALAYEDVEAPSITGFLSWIDQDALKIKRRVNDSADQVRVMTVHGAKGLEAPIVILPDTAPRQEGGNPPNVLRLEDGTAVWKTRGEDAPDLQSQAEHRRRAQVGAENRRLLYVALTRARTWLIVCGAGSPGKPESSWYGLVAEACKTLDPTRLSGVQGETLSLIHNWTDAPLADDAPHAPSTLPLPEWAHGSLSRPPVAGQRPLSPSALGGAHVLPDEVADTSLDAAARSRGTALHALLEILPATHPARWPAIAARLMPGDSARDALLEEAAAVLAMPEAAEVFARSALSEVDIAAGLEALDGARILGKIDRLIVTPGCIRAVDFKSNRLVPATPETVPEGILRQMGAYAAALAVVWPGRRIETAVLWTRTPSFMSLPGVLVAAALDRAGRERAGLAVTGGAGLLDPGVVRS